jgi:transposase
LLLSSLGADRNPIATKLIEAQIRESGRAADIMDTVGPGQIRLATRARDNASLHLSQGRPRRHANIRPASGCVKIPAINPHLYRFRNTVKRFFNKLRHFMAAANRFENHDANYLAVVGLTATINLKAFYEPATWHRSQFQCRPTRTRWRCA